MKRRRPKDRPRTRSRELITFQEQLTQLPDWERAAWAHIEEYARTAGDPHAVRHAVQVTSFGGVATTALCEHLRSAGASLPPGPDYWPFKHQRIPPPPDRVPDRYRIVYPYGDPRDAVVSVFRRGLQRAHYRRLHPGNPPPTPEVERSLESIESFAANGVDVFGIADHFDHWLHRAWGYPVAFVRFEEIPQLWDTLRDFLQLPREHPPPEILERASAREKLAPPVRAALDEMYGDFAQRLDELPALVVLERTT